MRKQRRTLGAQNGHMAKCVFAKNKIEKRNSAYEMRVLLHSVSSAEGTSINHQFRRSRGDSELPVDIGQPPEIRRKRCFVTNVEKKMVPEAAGSSQQRSMKGWLTAQAKSRRKDESRPALEKSNDS